MIPRVVAVPGSVTEIGPKKKAVAVLPPSRPVMQVAPTAGPGILGQLLFGLGYVPKSEVTSLGAQAASHQAQVSANAATIAGLQSALATAGASVASLTSQLAAANANISSLTSFAASLKARLAPLGSNIAGYVSQIASLKGELAADASTISSLTATLYGLQSKVRSYTVVNAAPTFGSGSAANFVSSDIPGGPYDPGSGPYGTGFAGFAPYVGAFAANFASLGTGSSTHAVPRFSASYAPGGRVASALGYVPKSEFTAEESQVVSLTSQIGAQGSQIQSLRGQLAAANASAASLTGQLTAANASVASFTTEISSLEGQINTADSSISSLQSQIASLTSQHSTNLLTIGLLDSSVSTWQGYLSAIQSGNLPVSFSWNFGDGATLPMAVLRDHRSFSVPGAAGGGGDGGGGGAPPPPPPGSPSPSHTYTGPGTFAPALTIGVTRPDGAVVSHTFQPPGFLIGRWPTSATVNIANNTFYFNVTDRNGVGVANARIRIVVYDIVGFRTGDTTVVTDVNGNNSQVGYYGSGHADGRVLRNPTL